MNLLKGRFDGDSGQPMFRMNDGTLLPLPDGVSRPTGTEAVYGIRPEYFAISPTDTGIPARVVVVEPLGPETQVTATVGEQTIVTVFHERLTIEPDDTIWLQPRAERVCLFDTNGRRLTDAATVRDLQET
jgi:multiple sugar transport system ATP-binding protein